MLKLAASSYSDDVSLIKGVRRRGDLDYYYYCLFMFLKKPQLLKKGLKRRD